MLYFSLPDYATVEGLLLLAVNKQINDKERVAAAMENPNLKSLVDECITVQY